MPDTEPGASHEADAPALSHEVEDLSPSVRRLVRQFDIDVKSLRGSGPEGRLRASDVMAAVGVRAPGEASDSGTAADAADDRASEAAASIEDLPGRSARAAGPGLPMAGDGPAAGRAENAAARAAGVEGPTPPGEQATAAETNVIAATMTTVFECDLSRVLAEQKAAGERRVSLPSYCAVAVARALDRLGPTGTAEPALVIVVYGDGGTARIVLTDPSRSTLEEIEAAVAAARPDAAGAGPVAASSAPGPRPTLSIHHHGLTGSVLATPTPIAPGEAASIGVGRVRRVVGVRKVNGEDAPRLVAQCLLSLTFRPERIELARASDFLGCVVRVLEEWDQPPRTAAMESAT